MSLFTNIPLHETIDIAVNLLLEKSPNLKIKASDLKRLFIFATAETNFLFDGKIYDQIDGVAMGSPLGPVLANLFMGHHEKNWINEYGANKITYYRRYVDDIFAVFDSDEEANNFFTYLNTRHDSIQFTMEPENENCLSFLDVLVKNDQIMTTSVFRKSTFTGLLTNFESYTAEEYKVSLVKSLLYRAFRISSSWSIFNEELENIYRILQRNSFPRFFIDQVASTFKKKHSSNGNDLTVEQNEPSEEIRYYKLPYIGKISELLQIKLNKLALSFCTASKAKISFTPFKIGQYFSPKDPIPKEFSSWVVYKFSCTGCNTQYIGETTVYYNTRKEQHFHKKTGASAVYKHLHEGSRCTVEKNLDSSFSIIDRGSTRFALKLKEALYVKWGDPELNRQKKSEKINLLV